MGLLKIPNLLRIFIVWILSLLTIPVLLLLTRVDYPGVIKKDSSPVYYSKVRDILLDANTA